MPNYTPSLSFRTQNTVLRYINAVVIFAVALGLELLLTGSITPGTVGFQVIMAGNIIATGIQVIIAFIIALIAALIGVSLISPVATTVGGALKNGNLTGAANSVTAQITLIFVTLVILGILVFLAMLGHFASKEAE